MGSVTELKEANFDDFISEVDVLIVTRGLQKGIIPESQFSKEKEDAILKSYQPITVEHMKRLRKDAYLDMILPRIFEVDRAVDNDPRTIFTKKEIWAEVCLAIMANLLKIKV